MAHDVFISYSSKDKSIADAICNHLEHDGIRCWIAPRDIVPGTTWTKAIVKAISASKVMVVVLSASSNGSNQVLREVGLAVNKKVIIVPVRIDEVTLSDEINYYINTEHWLDAITPPMEAHIAELSASLQTLLGWEPNGDHQPPPPPPPTRRFFGLTRAQLGLIGAGIALFALICLLVAGFVALKLLSPKASPTPGPTLALQATFAPPTTGNSPTATAAGIAQGGPTSTLAATTTPGTAPAASSGATWLRLTDLPRNINSIVVDPANPQQVFTASGGRGSGGFVYKSEDGGLTWKQASSGLNQQGISAMAISHDNPPVIYAISGKVVYASHDDAQSWQKVSTNNVMDGVFTTGIFISPKDSQLIFVTEDINSFSRSLDGGQNWAAVTIPGLPANIEGKTIGVSLAFDPSQSNTVYMGSEGAGVYKSTDRGDTWNPANKGMLDYKINSLAVSPKNPQVLLAGSDRGTLFRSQDGGGSWEDITSKVAYASSGYTGEITSIVIDPDGSIYTLVQGAGLFTSADDGERWRLLGKPGSVDSPYFSTMAYVGGAKPVFFIGIQDTGGWRYAASQPALAPTPTLPPSSSSNTVKLPTGKWGTLTDLPRQVNSVTVDPTNPKVMYAGTGLYGQGGGGVYKSEDGGLTWKSTSAGLGNEEVFAVAVSSTSPTTVYAAVGVRGDFYASQDSGQTWAKVGNNSFESGNMSTSLVISPKDGKVIIMVQHLGRFMRSIDGGLNWSTSPLGQDVKPGEYGISVLSAAFNPTDPSIIYAGTQGFGVWKSTDGGDTWSASNKGMLDYTILSIAVDPLHPQTVYACGDDRNGMFKSIDGGQTWVNITDKLPSQDARYFPPIQFVAIDPAAPDTVYLLVDRTGLVASTDGGLTWRLLGKPGAVDSPTFTAACMAFTPQLVMIAGIYNSGGWRYSAP